MEIKDYLFPQTLASISNVIILYNYLSAQQIKIAKFILFCFVKHILRSQYHDMSILMLIFKSKLLLIWQKFCTVGLQFMNLKIFHLKQNTDIYFNEL